MCSLAGRFSAERIRCRHRSPFAQVAPSGVVMRSAGSGESARVSDVQPHICGGVVAGEVNVPAPTRDESESRTPFVAGTVVAARRMRLRTEDQRPGATRGCGEGDPQRASARHAPDDLQLVTRARRDVARSDRKSPELSVATHTAYLVRGAADAEPGRRRASRPGGLRTRCARARRRCRNRCAGI
jgi:hypothetical protein